MTARAFTSEAIYGAAPIFGQGPSRPKIASGKGVPTPQMTAPTAQAKTAGLIDDPTFWLVAMIGAAAYLAIWSAS